MDLRDFIKTHIPINEHDEIEQALKCSLPLGRKTKPSRKKNKQNPPQPWPPLPRHGFLTAKERRQMGLFRLLPKKAGNLTYATFDELRKMWKAYMRELLDLKNYAHKEDHLESVIQIKVCRADYHGSNLTVTKSKCPSLIGLKGTVIMETRNTFQLITKRDELKVIPKKGSSFTYKLDGYVFTLSGSNLCCKPGERAVKKWKNKYSYDF